MARILCAWELGGHLGHVARFITIALRLRDRGHEVRFAVRDMQAAQPMLARQGFGCLQAPLWYRSVPGAQRPPESMPEILEHYGFRHPASLAPLVDGWRTLFDLASPDLLIGDYAPAAMLAARDGRFARAVIGSGFFLPPEDHPMPPIDPDGGADTARLAAAEARVTGAINAVLGARGIPPVSGVADAFAADERFLCTLPELDHYRRAPDTRYWGVVGGPENGAEPQWPAGSGPRIYAYVRARGGIAQRVIDALSRMRCRSVVFAPDLGTRPSMMAPVPHVRVSRVPLPLQRIATHCDLAIVHGGHDTTAIFLLAGCPLLLVPLHREQLGLARRVEQIGAGVVAMPADGVRGLEEVLTRSMEDQRLRECAAAFSGRPSRLCGAPVAEAVVDRCAELLRAGAATSGNTALRTGS